MPFMKEQIEFGKWVIVDTTSGGCAIPVDAVGSDLSPENVLPYTEVFKTSDILDISVAEKWGARLSAPGYMDCTEWVVFDSEKEARAYLEATYSED